ncbi:MAG: beta strand repeat-containing protein, partial [Candidatus Rokuibacteriota bacterium]
VFDGATGVELGGFFAYDPAFSGGMFVAAGDVTGDGRADIITGAGPGSSPHVKVFDGATGAELGGFLAYDPAFTGGVSVAAGDLTGDGRADIITGAGPGSGPRVKVFDGATGAELGGFFAYDPFFTGGVFVAAGDLTGDGRADIITGAGASGGPHVRVFDGVTGVEVASFFAYDPTFAGGLFVAAEVRTGGTVGSSPTTTVLASSVNPSVVGQPVTFTATVTTASGSPTGVVTFRDGSGMLGVSTLNAAGQATLTASGLTTGPHAITAEYGGNPTFAASSGGLTQTVDKAATSTAVDSSLDPSVFGQPVTFTATVSATPPGAGTPTGTVIFSVDGTPQPPVALAGAQATLTTTLSPVGDHTITAEYSGDGDFETSTSSAFTQTIDQAGTATALTSSLNPSGVGQAVTFTATVTAAPGTPTGVVEFFDGAASLGLVSLDAGGQAALTTSSLTVGSHPITAVYAGDPNFVGSTSPAVDQQVVQVAVDDGFPATGNIAIMVTAPGVLANDFAGAAVSLVQGGAAPGTLVGTTGGGTVTLNANGSFTYDPPTGVTATTDTFTYQATTGGGASSTATVTIFLTDILWFVCDGCPGTNAGTLLNPYTSIGAFSTANTGPPPAPQDNHKIYIRSGTYNGPTDTLALRSGQQVWGQGVAAFTVITPASGPNTHPDFAALAAGARPVIAPTGGNGITLMANNGVRHLDVGDVSGAATKLGGTFFGTLTIDNVSLIGTGRALDLTNGTLAATFDSIASTNSASTGISLTGTSGSLTVSGGTTVANSAGTGVRLDSNTATFTFADLLLAPANGQRALHATENSGTLTATSGTIATVNGVAVEITRISATTPLAVTLTSVSANGGANGIVLANTSGSFTVTGTGAPGTGGAIQNTTGADGAVAGNGIYLSGVTNVSLSSVTLANHVNHAIRGIDVTNFTLASSVVDGVNGTSAAADEGSVRFDDLLGSASITGTTIEGGVKDNVRVFNSSGALNPLTVNGGTIGLNDAVGGNDGILVLAEGTATVVATVTGVTFLGARSDLFQANALGAATLNVVLQDNTFQNAHPNIVGGGGGVTISGGDLTSNINVIYNVSGTTPGAQTFRQAKGSALTVNFVNGGGTATGTIQNNAIGQTGVEGSASTEGSGISVGAASTVTHTVTINNNVIRGVGTTTPADSGFAGIDAFANGDSQLNVTLTNNIIDEVAGAVFAGLYLLTGGDVADTARMCAHVQSNTVDASGVLGAFDLFGDYVDGTYGFPGFAGTTGGATLDAFLAGQNTFNGNGADTSAITSVDTATVCP